MQVEFSRQIFEKNKYQISSHPVLWPEPFHADWQMDKHDEANSRFSQFCQRA